jgi:hypothetical protein
MSEDNRIKALAELREEARKGFLDNYGLDMSEVETMIHGMDTEFGKALSKYLDAKMNLMMRQAFCTAIPLAHENYIKTYALYKAVGIVMNDLENIRQAYSDFVSELARLEKMNE